MQAFEPRMEKIVETQPSTNDRFKSNSTPQKSPLDDANIVYVCKKASNSNVTEERLSTLLDQFYNDVVDTEIFLLKKNYIPPFPKTAYCNFFKINSAII